MSCKQYNTRGYSCMFSKSYLLAQKELNNNYSIAQKQKNVNIRNYLIHQQRQWNKNKFDKCLILPEKRLGERGYLNICNVLQMPF